MPSGVRLQKFLAQCGVASRRKAEALIVAGRVRVNDAIARELGVTVNPGRDRVFLDGKELRQAHKGIMLLHKPSGVVSTMKDPHGRPSIEQYLTARYRSYFPVGRLDYESSGLVILTNDGELADRLLHPRYGLERRYEIEVEGAVTKATIRALQMGVTLDDGPVRAKIALIDSANEHTQLAVTVSEGRNRIVRRMMEHVGHPVTRLVRVMHGPFRLGSLKVGQVKRLSEREYEFYRRRVVGAQGENRGTPRRDDSGEGLQQNGRHSKARASDRGSRNPIKRSSRSGPRTFGRGSSKTPNRRPRFRK